MADKKEKQHSLYLLSPEKDRIALIHRDEVEDHLSSGWSKPDAPKANGDDWNREDDLAQQDVAADFAKQKAEQDAKKTADEAKAEKAAESTKK